MSPLSDEYLRSLEPESLRYDVTIFDDFVISVLPNGIKTWAFLYEYDGRTRRKTLGVYPDMSYEQAEDALDNARDMILKLGDDIKDSPVEPDTRQVEVPAEIKFEEPPPDPVLPSVPVAEPAPTPEPAPEPVIATRPAPPESRPAVLASRRRKRYHTRPYKRGRSGKRYFALGVLCVLALGAAVILLPRLGGGGTTTSAAPAEQDTSGRAAPAPIVVENEPEPRPENGRAAPAPIILDETPAPAAVAQTPPAQAVPVPVPQPEPIVEAPPISQAPPAPEPEPEPPVSETPQRVAAIAQPETPTASAPNPSAPIETDATATGGQVTRSVVTSDVADLEPVDNLGPNIALNDGGFQTVFYFTELRNFTAGQIVHRWVYNGRVIADVPLRVDGGWRWRTYSSKDLLPGMTGEWSVSVIDGDGRELGRQEFRFDL